MNKQSAFAYVSRVITQSAKSLAATCVLLDTNIVCAQPVSQGKEAVTVGSVPEAMDALVERYGYVVTLETPPYVYEDDLQDEMALRNDSGRVSKSIAPKILTAKGLPLTLSLPPAANVGRVEMSSVVKQLAQNVSTSDRGAHYRVEQEGDVFHIIPSEVRDANGTWVPHTPIFDTPISIPTAERSIRDTVQAVCSALGTANHVHVGLLVYPLNTLHYSSSTVGASNEVARSVLTRALAGLDRKLTWRVFYDIPMNSYLLSIIFVPDRTSLASSPQPIPARPTAPVGTGTNSASSPVSVPKH
jgi:hypothetical protein